MKYVIHIKSNKIYELTDNSEFYEKTIMVEANDYYDAVMIAMEETSKEKIDDTFLPITTTISKAE